MRGDAPRCTMGLRGTGGHGAYGGTETGEIPQYGGTILGSIAPRRARASPRGLLGAAPRESTRRSRLHTRCRPQGSMYIYYTRAARRGRSRSRSGNGNASASLVPFRSRVSRARCGVSRPSRGTAISPSCRYSALSSSCETSVHSTLSTRHSFSAVSSSLLTCEAQQHTAAAHSSTQQLDDQGRSGTQRSIHSRHIFPTEGAVACACEATWPLTSREILLGPQVKLSVLPASPAIISM